MSTAKVGIYRKDMKNVRLSIFPPQIWSVGDWSPGLHCQHGRDGGLRHPPGPRPQGEDERGPQHRDGRVGAAHRAQAHGGLPQDATYLHVSEKMISSWSPIRA